MVASVKSELLENREFFGKLLSSHLESVQKKIFETVDKNYPSLRNFNKQVDEIEALKEQTRNLQNRVEVSFNIYMAKNRKEMKAVADQLDLL